MKDVRGGSRRGQTIGIVAFVLITVALTVTNFAQQPGSLAPVLQNSREPHSTPISSMLNVDGSLKAGVACSFDPKGFRMIAGLGGAPRFVADDSGTNILSPATNCADGWDDRFWLGGALGDVYAVASDSAGNLYIGGRFTHVGNIAANNIARWNGVRWSALGSGTNSDVNAIAVSGSDIYAGGAFSVAGGVEVNKIAKWDGSGWSALTSGVGGAASTVWAIAVSGGDVYVGGYFTFAGGAAANNIAKWNDSGWSGLASGITVGEVCDPDYGCWYGAVYAIAVVEGDVYAGGWITSAGGVPGTQGLAKWNGSSWSSLGGGTDSSVLALAVSGTDVYAGGWFTTAGGVSVNHIAKWNGSSWSAVGSGLSVERVSAIVVSGADIYAAYWTVGGEAGGVSRWNGSSWSTVGTEMDSGVRGVAIAGANIYAGGYFRFAGGAPGTRGIAEWNGSNWKPAAPVGSGIAEFSDRMLSNSVYAVAVSGTDVYVGGNFPSAGGVPGTQGIAKWNGSSWSALGSGIGGIFNPYVLAIAVSGTDVYVAGSFTSAGGVAANKIAKWNGSSWSALGTGLGDGASVQAIAVSGSDVYVGGSFTSAGGVAANNVAKWNGSAWSALGTGILGASPYIPAIAVSGNDVYVGGKFTSAGGVAVNNIAKWNGSNWSALGSGVGGGTVSYPPNVYAIAISGSDVYVGGQFTQAGGVAAKYIAKWNGSSWSPVGSGMGGGLPSGNAPATVYGFAVSGSDLYAGGRFTSAGGTAANTIAKWNGSSWSALGSGTNYGVNTLAVSGSDLYVGGYFTTAGCHAANKFSRYSLQRKALFDFDGDGRSDISVFRPSDSVWYLNQSTDGFFAIQFGLSNDKIVPADFDGDGKTDIAVFRDGVWWIRKSSDRVVESSMFGQAGDIPVPADYTGDGRDELAVYRNGQWWALDLSNGQSSLINFGLPSDKPVPADYDGDGRVDQAVYRNGEWHLNRSTLGYTVALFGLSSDRPVVGDYDGDGRADLAVYRDGTWYLLQSTAGFTAFQWGLATDTPAPADYDGDGKTEAAVFRNGVWYLNQSTGGVSIQQFGLVNDKPIAAAYVP